MSGFAGWPGAGLPSALLALTITTSGQTAVAQTAPEAVPQATAGIEPTTPAAATAADLAQAAGTALAQGDSAQARLLALQAIQADQKNVLGQYVLALASLRLGDPVAGARAGRLAFRHAGTPVQRHTSALVTAQATHATGRAVAARWWLRRAADTAPDAQSRARVLAALRQVSATSIWSFGASLTAIPSDNVNAGADSPFNVIDGLPWVGNLSGDAQALSGVVASADLSATRVLSRSIQQETAATARLYLKRVALSSDAQAVAPTARNADFGRTALEFGLSQRRALSAGRVAGFGMTLGSTWEGGVHAHDFAELSADLTLAPRPSDRLRLGIAAEHRAPNLFGAGAEARLGASASLQHKRRNGDTAGLALSVQGIGSDNDNARGLSLGAQASYALGQPVGPFSLSGRVGLGLSDFPDYRLGFITPPGGRQDVSAFAEIGLGLPQAAFAGFEPSLNLRVNRTSSNISRFTTSETALALGLRAQF